MVNNLFNLIGLAVVLGLALNTVGLSMLVYHETQILSIRKGQVNDVLSMIRQHCRIIGVSVLVMPMLSMAVGADLAYQVLRTANFHRGTRDVANHALAADNRGLTLSEVLTPQVVLADK